MATANAGTTQETNGIGDADPRTLGATLVPEGVRFRVWAPNAERIEVVLEGSGESGHRPLARGADGMHGGIVPGIGAGARYRYRLDGGDAFPDPAARFQPAGVHGPSEVIDPAFPWSDDGWPGLAADGLVVYELHVGTYTPEGTFRALIAQLPHLKALGVTAVELLPVADFPGARGWGYDGVALWAPTRAYGPPDDLRALVDAAHAAGLGVILDVVYNHLGPDGNYLRAFAADYFTDRHHTPWGEAINYDGPGSRQVRDFVIGNALSWLTDYHIDGLRLDATHAILDDSPSHILAELADRARAAIDRQIVLIAEDERPDPTPIRDRERGGHGLDAVWADGFHHELHVRLTGEQSGYFAGYAGTADGIANAIRGGFVTPADHDDDGAPDGDAEAAAPWLSDEPARSFVFCTQNHDQVGNRAFGERLEHLVGRDAAKVAAAVLLTSPETPLIFMGEEFAASSPFQYFTDHEPDLGALVSEGRAKEFGGLGRTEDHPDPVPDPQDEATFLRSKLDLSERASNASVLALYTELLRLRREDPVLRVQDRARTRAAGIGDVLALHRWTDDGHRLLLANTGTEPARMAWSALPAALNLPADADWSPLLATDEARFGGHSGLPTPNDTGIDLPGKTAVLLAHP